MRRPKFYPFILVFLLLFSACDLLGLPGGSDDSYTLTVRADGSGEGRVRSSPVGIGCGTDCSEVFDAGTRVTLTATPEEGSTFAGWSESGCSDSDTTCEVELTADRTVTATFDAQPADAYQLTVEVVGSGTVSSEPGGIECGTDCDETYPASTNVTLTANPGDGSKFVSWSAAGCSGSTCEVALTADKTIKATFAPQDTPTYQLSVQLGGEGSGTVTSEPGGIECGDDCEEDFLEQTEVTLTATPEEGSTFAGWAGACDGESCSVIMSEARQVTARFNPGESPDGVPTITSFSADDTDITAGESVTLSWQVENAESLVLQPLGNVNGTSLEVTLTETTTYILEATNDAGTTTSDPVEVTVTPSAALPQITSFSADSETIPLSLLTLSTWSLLLSVGSDACFHS